MALFKVLKEFPMYEIYEDGKVFSKYSSKFLRQKINNSGYYQLSLKDINNKTKYVYTHRLVAQAFVKNTFNKPNVNHKDLNRLNNNFVNLEWCTQKENLHHAKINGRFWKQELNGIELGKSRRKLTKKEVLEIYKQKNKNNITYLVKKYNVHKSTIWRIFHKKVYEEFFNEKTEYIKR